MTTKPTRPAKKLPKGRVLWQLPKYADGIPAYCKFPFVCSETVPVAVLPCRTAKEARAWVRLHGMGEDELREVIDKKTPYNHRAYLESITYRDGISATLRALGLISK